MLDRLWQRDERATATTEPAEPLDADFDATGDAESNRTARLLGAVVAVAALALLAYAASRVAGDDSDLEPPF